MNFESHGKTHRDLSVESSVEHLAAEIASSIKVRDAKQAEFLRALSACVGTEDADRRGARGPSASPR